MDLPTTLQLITTIAIVIGVGFGAYEIRGLRERRTHEAQILLANSFYTAEFQNANRKVLGLPDGASRANVDMLIGGDTVFYWLGAMEALGILVHHRQIPIELVDDFFSGPVVISWHKLEPYVEETRAVTQRATMHEWFQWLAERMIERERAKPPVPAHIQHRDWRP
jgi:hypothetical protein